MACRPTTILSPFHRGRYHRQLFEFPNLNPLALIPLIFLLPLAAAIAPPAGPDTLVVCPSEFRPALVEWQSYRRSQGHVITVVEPLDDAEQVSAAIRRANQSGQLKYLVLIGDEAVPRKALAQDRGRSTVPTNYVRAKINVRWGSTAEIASDTPYADIDGDELPDLAVGRIPAHSAGQLAATLRKIIRYEQQPDHGSWERSLNIVAGAGGFGAVTDALVEAAGRQVIEQTVPPEYSVTHLVATTSTDGRAEIDFGERARRQLNEGGLAWIYLGHGLPTELASAPHSIGKRSILSTRDVPNVRCDPHNPLAVLIACYTGAMDSPQSCLAEELLLAERGPIAVIAATRVTMPYGNTVMGCELLRACFQDQPAALGDVLRLAQRRVLSPTPNDPLRNTLDSMAEWLGPAAGVDLVNERREHVLMYHLIGDPLLRLRRSTTRVAQISSGGAVGK